MHIHWLQHVPFEGLGIIENWAARHGHTLSCTRFWASDELPEPDPMDMLVVMGGPMGIHDYEMYPWLVEEKKFIRQALDRKRVILGICLGAQLLASVCGASVYPNGEKEIGWFPLTRKKGIPNWIGELLPEKFTTFHWHGDTFDTPDSAVLLGSSAACMNQGFIIGDRVIALQFHPEMTSEGLKALVEHCRGQLDSSGSAWVQTERQILDGQHHLAASHQIMEKLLDHCAWCIAGS